MPELEIPLPPANGATVAITGINGYLASSIGLEALKRGYAIVGTCRSLQRCEPLLKGAYLGYARGGRVKIVEVEDMTKEGAFDEAVKGVAGIIHTASPINFSLESPSLVLTPAVAGTTGILRSALRHAGRQLRTVVVTSSVAAIASPKPEGSEYTFTEKDWNDHAGNQVKAAAGADCPSNLVYAASKTAAERAVWEFRRRENPPFAISALNPTVVYGPPIIPHPNPAALNETIRPVLALLTGTTPGGAVPAKIGVGAYVDVRDVARAHLWALEHPTTTDGERFIVAAGLGPPQAIADILRDAYPERSALIPVGNPGEGYVKDGYGWFPPGPGVVGLDAGKLEVAMGIEWIKFDKCILDTARYMERYL